MEQVSGVKPEGQAGSSSILHRVELERFGFSKEILIAGLAVAFIAAILTGYFLSGKGSFGLSNQKAKMVNGVGGKSGAKSAGVKDLKAFPDCAKGQLDVGGQNGEGTHHLIREGGPSQTAYLLSSVVDLDQFTGKMVEICGKSIASRRVSWLMDVGYVVVVE